jgi:hypothetical protein
MEILKKFATRETRKDNNLEQESIDIGYLSSILHRRRVIFLKVSHELR